MLSQLLENAKKSGRVAAKDIAAAEEAGAPAEALARFYDAIDAAGIEIDIGADGLALCMDFEDGEASAHIRLVDDDLAVETAGAPHAGLHGCRPRQSRQ